MYLFMIYCPFQKKQIFLPKYNGLHYFYNVFSFTPYYANDPEVLIRR